MYKCNPDTCTMRWYTLLIILLGTAEATFLCLLSGDTTARSYGAGGYKNTDMCFTARYPTSTSSVYTFCGICRSCFEDYWRDWGYYCPGDGNKYPCPTPNCSVGQYMWYDMYDDINCQYKCADCLPDHYCPGNISSAIPCTKTPCDIGKYELSPCTALKDRQCSACALGTALYNGTCLTCPPGFYCFNNTAYACPNASTSRPGAMAYVNCYCMPGYSGAVHGPNNSTCVPCKIGTFCPGTVPVEQCSCA